MIGMVRWMSEPRCVRKGVPLHWPNREGGYSALSLSLSLACARARALKLPVCAFVSQGGREKREEKAKKRERELRDKKTGQRMEQSSVGERRKGCEE